MPGMNGYQLADRVTRIRPATRVVVMSGYSEDTNGGTAEFRFPLLQKPFTPDSLIRAVLHALEQNAQPGLKLMA